MEQYTKHQIDDAKAYLRQRIDNEVSMEADVGNLLEEYARLLVALIMSGASQEHIDALVEDLIARLLDDCETLAVDEHDDDRDSILAFILRAWGDNNLEGRIRWRVGTFFDEVLAISVAGMLLGVPVAEVIASVIMSLKAPWQNPILIEIRKKILNGQVSPPEGVDFSERHYGHGVPLSSLTALIDITRFAVAEGWNWYDYDKHKDNAKGYFVFRGSSYPCDECDSHVGYHPASDTSNLPLFHKHCYCYVVWV